MRMALRKNKGLALVVGLIIALGGVGVVMRGAGASVVVPAGYDTFTTPDDAQTFDEFSSHPIPAGFFGEGSKEFTGTLTLKGGPPVNQSKYGSADTVIQRVSSVTVPGRTTLTVTGLSFVSASPITVAYENGKTETWNVSVSQSSAINSGGSMYFKEDGTFTSSLAIYPKYTFTRDGAAAKVFDTGDTGGAAPINLSSTNGRWSQSGRVTVINPGTEQDRLAAHNIQPAPTPCPVPTATVVPGPGPGPGPIAIDRQANSVEANAIAPCVATDTVNPAP